MADSQHEQTRSPVDWEVDFRSKLPLYERLASEAEFALSAALEKASIKVHRIQPRVKTEQSLREKAARKGYDDPMRQAEDLAGVRVVVLFRSDLRRVRGIIHDLFEVVSEEDTIDGGEPSNFGYMSVHYIARLKDEHSGPRYDGLKGLKIEIQVRTIVTDAWDSLSRYLDYKGESSIPTALRRDFFALSGLFYVADQHFEIFFSESERSQAEAQAAVTAASDQPVELNLDTLAAYLRERFPQRKHAVREDVSVLVEDITNFGFTTIDQLSEYLDQHDQVVDQYEASSKEEDIVPGFFSDVGAARITLRETMPAYDRFVKERGTSDFFDPDDQE